MSNDPFKGIGNNLTGAVKDMLSITPHDSNLFDDGVVAIGLYITVGGTVKFTTSQGNARTVTVPDNFYLICLLSECLTEVPCWKMGRDLVSP